jgi:hypothetical protein
MKQLCWILLLLFNLSLSQSTISLEQFASVRNCDECEPPEELEYIADLNNTLDRYIGHWEGIQGNLKVQYRIQEFLDVDSEGLKKDILKVRYKVSNMTTGQVILNTLELPEDDNHILRGWNYIGGKYYAYYLGYDGCGQRGYAILDHDQRRLTGEVTFKIHILLTGEPFDPSQCPNGRPESPIPSGVELTKV